MIAKRKERNAVNTPKYSFLVLVATHSKHVASRVGAKAKCVGMATISVEPASETIIQSISKLKACVVLIDAQTDKANALAVSKAVSERVPEAKLVILGSNADLELAARAIVAGASCFVLESTPPAELADALSRAAAGKDPNEQTMFGRVYSSLALPGGRDGWFRTPSGHRLTTEDAIKQWDQFGLSADEIAAYLQVRHSEAENVARQTRAVIRPSLISQISDLFTPAGGSSRSSIRVLVIALASLVMLRLAVLVLFGAQKHGIETTEVNGRLVSKLSATQLRGLHICFWPMSSKRPQQHELRPSTVRVWSENGDFTGTVIMGRSDPHHGAGREYAVTILTGEYDPFPEAVVPPEYGDPATTPLRVQNLNEQIVIKLPPR
jgi:DNA-binding NarL/FixJ family response regulator